MKKKVRKKIDYIIVILFLLCILVLLIDFTYAGRINCNFFLDKTFWLGNLLSSIGFQRCIAMTFLQSGAGMALTLMTIVLNMGNNLFIHSERKVFGLSLGDLRSDQSWIYRLFLKLSIIFPLLIIVTINLELCGTSYLLLFCCYLAVFCNYYRLAMSYDKKVQRDMVVSQLLELVEDGKDCIESNMIDYDLLLEAVRKGIREDEGWNNAWLFFGEFLKRAMKYDCDKCFMLSCHFFEVIFNVYEEEYVQQELMYIMKYISGMEGHGENEEREYMVLWALLCSTALHWDLSVMQHFLEWFIDISERSSQRILTYLNQLNRYEIQKQSAIVMVMLEYWVNIEDDAVNIEPEYIAKINGYGEGFFIGSNEEFLRRLDYLYQKKNENKEKINYNAAQVLYKDIKFQVNNTVIRTKLIYN